MNMDYNYNDNYKRKHLQDDLPADLEPGQYDPEVLEEIRLARIRRQKADQLARDRLHAQMVLFGAAVAIIVFIIVLIVRAGREKEPSEPKLYTEEPTSQAAADENDGESSDDGGNGGIAQSITENSYDGEAEGHELVVRGGITYVDGIMVVNKTFSLPSDYTPGLNSEMNEAFNQMAAQAWEEGISLWICSGYRSYDEQVTLFENYAAERGLTEADSVSARPGHSEHQSGLCIDVNSTDFSFGSTAEAAWLEEHCAEYGFIIRFPEGKEDITGYEYEPWHIRYVGVETAQEITAQGLCLEEYLNVTSDYANSPDNERFLQNYSEYDY